MGNDFKIILEAMIDNSSLSNAQKDIAKERLKISADISVDEFAKSKAEIQTQIEKLGAVIKSILSDSVTDKQSQQWAKQYYDNMVAGAKRAAKEQEKLNQQMIDDEATRQAIEYYEQEKYYQDERQKYLKEGTAQQEAFNKEVAETAKYYEQFAKQAFEEEAARQAIEYYEQEKYYQDTRKKYLEEGKIQQEAFNSEVKETVEYYKRFAAEAEKAYVASQRIAKQQEREHEKEVEAIEKLRLKTIETREAEEKRQQILADKSHNDALREEYELQQKIAERNLKQSNSIQISVENGDYRTQLLQYETALQKAGIAGQELTDKMEAARTAYDNLISSTTGDNIIPEVVIENAKKLNTEMTKLKNETRTINMSNSLIADDLKVDATITRLNEQLRKNSAYTQSAKDQIHAFINELEQGNVAEDRLSQINVQAKTLHAHMARLNKTGKSFGDSIKDQASKFTQWLSVSSVIMKGVRSIDSAISTVRELDTALVDLQKTTDGTIEELENFYYQSNEIAKNLGTTTEEVINAASAWSRLGYSIQDAMTMAEYSSIFASISPEMDIDSATDGLVSMMKAFGIEAEESLDGIISKVNAVGNSFAVSNDMIVEAMQRSSSAMVAANNTLDQTIAMNTAATEITQNAEVTSNALRTMSMRIRGYDEETEEYVGGIEELTGKIADLTKTAATPGGISLFTDETRETYKSTYDLLDEISVIYDDLSDKSQAELLEALAGKRSAQSVAALISNFDQARAAMDVMSESAGGAMQEMEIIYDSLDYKINRLSETGTGIAQNLFARDDIKIVIDGLTSVAGILDTVTESLGLFGTIGLGSAATAVVAFIKNLDWLKMPSYKESCLDFLVGLV